MYKLGLTFAGGGGKGSYEIGVWKYLHQIGLDKYVSVVSGASVGALNAVLFMNGDLDIAEKIWREQIENKITKNYSVKKTLSAVRRPDKYGFCSRTGLLYIIDNNIDLDKISKTTIKAYVALEELPHITNNHFVQAVIGRKKYFKPTYKLLNGNKPDTIKELLLASSAIPGVFAAEKVGDKFYYDGGLKDNVPVKPLYDEGCTHAIVIHLSPRGKGIFKYESNFNHIIHINPSRNLGKGKLFKGALDFSPEGVNWRISLGEWDSKNKHASELKAFLEDFS